MNNGCICCTACGDLRIVDGLMRHKGRFDAILIEITASTVSTKWN